MNAVIALSGTDLEYERLVNLIEGDTLIIAADGGGEYLRRMGILPKVVIGDFDSLSLEDLGFFREQGSEIIAYPSAKDQTDGELAILEARRRGSLKIYLTGSEVHPEIDHFLGNVFLLSKYPGTYMVGNKEILFGLDLDHQPEVSVLSQDGKRVSLMPLGMTVVHLSGFRYSGVFRIGLGDTLTLRNELMADQGHIQLVEGKILVLQGK